MRPLIKTHGGKFRIKDWVISHLPQNYESLQYVEPFCGGCSILLNKKLSVKEVISDLDWQTYNLLKNCKDSPTNLIYELKCLTYSELEFNSATNRYSQLTVCSNYTDYRRNILAATEEYVIRRMSRGGLGKDFAWSHRQRGGKPGDLNSWETSLENISKVSKRLKNVEILNEDFRVIITRFDSPNTIFYCDPPYLTSTRTAKNVYNNEMSQTDHEELLNLIINTKGKVLISGYSSKLYDHYLWSWNFITKKVANNSGQGKIKQERKEVLWANY